MQQLQEQQAMPQQAIQQQAAPSPLRLQQIRDEQNAKLWREAEEEEEADERQQQAVIQQKKQEQLMQLHQQEQAHPATPAAPSVWTSIRAAMPSVTLQFLYNVILLVIAGSAVAFSLRSHVVSAVNQAR